MSFSRLVYSKQAWGRGMTGKHLLVYLIFGTVCVYVIFKLPLLQGGSSWQTTGQFKQKQALYKKRMVLKKEASWETVRSGMSCLIGALKAFVSIQSPFASKVNFFMASATEPSYQMPWSSGLTEIWKKNLNKNLLKVLRYLCDFFGR